MCVQSIGTSSRLLNAAKPTSPSTCSKQELANRRLGFRRFGRIGRMAENLRHRNGVLRPKRQKRCGFQPSPILRPKRHYVASHRVTGRPATLATKRQSPIQRGLGVSFTLAYGRRQSIGQSSIRSASATRDPAVLGSGFKAKAVMPCWAAAWSTATKPASRAARERRAAATVLLMLGRE